MNIAAVGIVAVRVGLAMTSFVGAAAAAVGQYYCSSFDIAKRYDAVGDGYYNALYVNILIHVHLEVMHIGCIYSITSSSLWLVLLYYKLDIARSCDYCLVFCYTKDNNDT